MIDIKKFSALQKASKNSFMQQKQIVKKVMAGQAVLCVSCQQPLKIILPQDCTETNKLTPGVRCKKGCTDLQLDFA